MYKTHGLLQGNVGVIDTTAVLESMACLLPIAQEDAITLDVTDSPVSEKPNQSVGEVSSTADKVTGDDIASLTVSDQSQEDASEVPTTGGGNVHESESGDSEIECTVARDEEAAVDSTEDLQQSDSGVEGVTSNVDVSEGLELSTNNEESERNYDVPE